MTLVTDERGYMVRMTAAALLTAATIHSAQLSPLSDKEEIRFYTSERDLLFKEYLTCTGDSTPVSLERVIAWRRRLYDATDAPEYRDAARAYMAHTGASTVESPCLVFQWQNQFVRGIEKTEDELTAKMQKLADRTIDTIHARSQLAATPLSPLDFQDIPLGISATALKMRFSERRPHDLSPLSGTTLSAKGVPLDSALFDVFFEIDSSGRYCEYRVEGKAYPPDSLDSMVRPQAHHLVRWLERRIGPPDRQYRIGLFDIKEDRTTPYALWRRDGREAVVGIGADSRSFLARAIVRLDPQKPEEDARRHAVPRQKEVR